MCRDCDLKWLNCERKRANFLGGIFKRGMFEKMLANRKKNEREFIF